MPYSTFSASIQLGRMVLQSTKKGKLDTFWLIRCELAVANHKLVTSPKFVVISVVLLRSAFLEHLPPGPGTGILALGKSVSTLIWVSSLVIAERPLLQLAWK